MEKNNNKSWANCIIYLIALNLSFLNTNLFAIEISQDQSVINSALLRNENGKAKLYVGASQILTPGPDISQLFVVETPSMKFNKISLPQEYESEHIVALIPSSKNHIIYLITQMRKAGLSKPTLHSYDLEEKKFETIRANILCTNITTVNIKKGELILDCGKDLVHPAKSKHFSIKNANFAPDIEAQKINWISKKPNSIDEADALVVKSEKDSFYLSAKALFKNNKK